MKFTRRTGMAALAAAPLLAALPACNRGGGEGGGEDLDIALVSKGFQHQFWQAVQQGADEAAEEHGVSITFDGPAAETEVDAQLQMFQAAGDRKSTRLNSSHVAISYAVFCLKKKKNR